MKAWSLLVVSTDSQSETLDDYRRMADEDARKNGWTIEREFEGVSSGKLGPRSKVIEMVAALQMTPKELRPEWIWMRRTDRVSRGPRVNEGQAILHAINDLGARIWDHDRGEIRLDTPMDQAIEFLMQTLSTQENLVRRGKAIEKYRQRRAAGVVVGNKLPYGLALGPGRTYVAKEPHAEAVRVAFRMGAAGKGCVQIARELDKIAPPQQFANGRVHVTRWTTSRISHLLRSRAYIGPIVDEVTFVRAERARAAVSHTATGIKYKWPLGTALRCYCGRAMGGMVNGPRGYRYRYYACRARWNHDGHIRLVPAGPLEAQFVELLKHFGASPALVERTQHAADPVSPKMLERSLRAARDRLAVVERKRASVLDLFTEGKVRGEDVQPQLDAYSADRAQLLERIREIEAQQLLLADRHRSAAEASQLFGEAADLFMESPEDKQRGIARAVAIAFGGLCVEEDRRLVPRPVPDNDPQRRRQARHV